MGRAYEEGYLTQYPRGGGELPSADRPTPGHWNRCSDLQLRTAPLTRAVPLYLFQNKWKLMKRQRNLLWRLLRLTGNGFGELSRRPTRLLPFQ